MRARQKPAARQSVMASNSTTITGPRRGFWSTLTSPGPTRDSAITIQVGNFIPNALQTVAAGGITIQNLGPWTASIFGRYFGPAPLIEDNTARSNSTTIFSAQATYRINPKTQIRFDVFNIFNANTNDITYFYASRLPGEPPEGVNDYHFHPTEPRSFRLGLLYNF